MKALSISRYSRPEDLQIQEVPKPTPDKGQVLVKVYYTAVNDWDWALIRGQPYIYRLFMGIFRPRIKIPGVDISGIIESIGEGVTKFSVGDEVLGDLSEAGFGGFAEYVCVHEDALLHKPSEMTFEEAAAVPHAAALASQGLEMADLQENDNLLINGAGGGVGTYGVQLVKLKKVKATGVDSDIKLDMMRDVGFDNVIDYKKIDFTSTGERYDMILDAKTSRSVFSYARALRPGGIYVTVGGAIPALISLLVLGKLYSLFSKKSFQLLALKPNRGLETVLELYQSRRIKTIIDGPYPFEELPRYIAHFGAAKHLGKVIIKVANGESPSRSCGS